MHIYHEHLSWVDTTVHWAGRPISDGWCTGRKRVNMVHGDVRVVKGRVHVATMVGRYATCLHDLLFHITSRSSVACGLTSDTVRSGGLSRPRLHVLIGLIVFDTSRRWPTEWWGGLRRLVPS